MKLHLVMQPKGGAGKSFTAIHLIQFLTTQGKSVGAFDLDSANNTLSQFEALEALPVDIRSDTNSRKIDSRKFDGLLEKIVESDKSDVVVDIGASIIGEFSAHLSDLDFFNMTQDLNLEVLIHVPISGGQGLIDNMGGLKSVHDFVGDKAQYLIWANPFFGDLEHNGVPLENSKLMKGMKKSILGIVQIPEWDSDSKKEDIKKMVTAKKTYDEIDSGSEYNVFTKSRLKAIKTNFFARIEVTGL